MLTCAATERPMDGRTSGRSSRIVHRRGSSVLTLHAAGLIRSMHANNDSRHQDRDHHRRQLGHRAARRHPARRARRRRDPDLQHQSRGAQETVATIEDARRHGRRPAARRRRQRHLRRLRRAGGRRDQRAAGSARAFDYLVNNAGFGQMSMFADTTEELYDRFHRVILKGPFFLTQTLLPLLADGGAIVNTTSNSALPNGIEAGYSAYGSMKGGLAVLTRYLAKELSARGIRVNSVAPGPTRTGMISDDVVERYPEVIALARRAHRARAPRRRRRHRQGHRRPAVGRVRVDHRREHRSVRRLQPVARTNRTPAP